MKARGLFEEDLFAVRESAAGVETLAGSSLLITGACGLICSALARFFLALNERERLGVRLYLGARSRERTEARFAWWREGKDYFFLPYDATKPLETDIPFDYIVHGAGNANPAMFVSAPVETMLANLYGTDALLSYSRKKGSKRLLYISSSEVYGKKSDGQPYREDEYFSLDILNARACYPSSKRAAETLCAAYRKEYGADVVIVRPGHIYGPTMTERDDRASSQFPRDVLGGRDIVMKSAGSQRRSYCYVADCASAIAAVLAKGACGEAYNISNRRSLATIREMAEAFARAGGRSIVFDTPTASEVSGYNLMDSSVLCSEKLEALGWEGKFDLPTGAEHTLRCLQEGL